MSTAVYHGLPSFLESQLNESRMLRLKLASPRSHLSHSFEMAVCTVLDSDPKILSSLNSGDPLSFRYNNPAPETSPKPQLGGLSFLQTLPSVCQAPAEKQSSYVHPLVKRASSMLSDKSLELCTENLGSETGTDIIEDENNIFSRIRSDAEIGDQSRKARPKKRHVARSRKTAPKFPPPLSTMTGPDAVQVRPIRENGRLILQAVKVQPKVSCFYAERSNGRLRLRLSEHASTSSSSDLDATDNEYVGTARDDNYQADDDFECYSNNSSEGQQGPENRRESWTQGDVVSNSTVAVGGGSGSSGNVDWRGSCEESGHGNTEGLLLGRECPWMATSS
uniref:FAF domain-containing protein n=1 Tax=Kalanchoe fedtschenkoi TaxID=63787 RepID=A0A7N0V6G3_KALFE